MDDNVTRYDVSQGIGQGIICSIRVVKVLTRVKHPHQIAGHVKLIKRSPIFGQVCLGRSFVDMLTIIGQSVCDRRKLVFLGLRDQPLHDVRHCHSP